MVAFGNGNNDRKMLKIARVGIAVLRRRRMRHRRDHGRRHPCGQRRSKPGFASPHEEIESFFAILTIPNPRGGG
ncbi:MAG: hypothetical protein P8Y63_05005 [Deltaproteobacteria bacterium]